MKTAVNQLKGDEIVKVGVICFSLGLGLASGIAQANLLSNGDLDRTYMQEIVPGFSLPKPDQWMNVGSRSITGPYEDEMSSEPWAGPMPTPATTNGFNVTTGDANGLDWGVFFKPFSGNMNDGPATGHLYQDVAGSAGLTYTMTGWAGAEANFMAGGAVFAIDFLNAGGGIIGSTEYDLMPTLRTPNGQSFAYKQYSLSGVAPTGTSWVRTRASMIDAMGNPAGGGQAFVVDDFTLTAVPEPATMAVLGLGVLAAARRKIAKRK